MDICDIEESLQTQFENHFTPDEIELLAETKCLSNEQAGLADAHFLV